MKLTKREVAALAQEFKRQLEARNKTVTFPKWKASLQGKKAQKLINEIKEKRSAIDNLHKQIDSIKNQIRKEFKILGYHELTTLDGIYNNRPAANRINLAEIENALIVACIDSTSVKDLMSKLEAKFKTK